MAIKLNRLQDTEERNKKIAEMDLEELKRYLCMKNYQNPEKCPSCQSRKNCTAGQRAIVLLNERELRKMEIEGKTGKSKAQQIEETRRRFVQALNQPDMIQYLIDNCGNNRNSAIQRLKYWAKHYTDIAEEYDFWGKLQKISRSQPANLKATSDAKTNSAKERYREAVAQTDPVAFIMEKYGINRAKALHNLNQWKKRYGVIEKEEKPMEEEVSVEDFLREMKQDEPEEEVQPTEEAVEEIAVGTPVFDTSDHFHNELNAKFHELEVEKAKLKDRLVWIEKAQDALAMTLNLFDPNSVIGRAVSGT